MIRALVTGSLYGDPQPRTSQAGKQFVTAKIRTDGKGESVWCSIIAFGEIADRLVTLGNGAALAVSGKAEVNGWLDKQGEPKAGLSLVVDEVATLKGKPLPPQGAGDAPNVRQGQGSPQRPPRQGSPQRPQRQGSPQRPQRPTRQPVAAGAGFDDDLPDCFS